jgi:uncharacterized small protein (DUF1192 family)
MAEINKLSVNKVLEKLRSNDAKDDRSRVEKLNDKIEALDEEVERLRAQASRLRRSRKPGTDRN